MIVSHKHRFVFVKPMKVAGSSIENAIYPLLGDEDIVGHNGTENLKILRGLGKKCAVHKSSHASVDEIIQIFGREIIDYTFVSVARNPWDRAVSLFYWNNEEARDQTIDETKSRFRKWVLSGGVNFDRVGSYYWRGYPGIDILVKYEELERGFAEVSQRLALPGPIDTTHHSDKADVRPTTSRDFGELYSQQIWNAVGIVGARDIRVFGYSKRKPKGNDQVVAAFNARPLRRKMAAVSKAAKAVLPHPAA